MRLPLLSRRKWWALDLVAQNDDDAQARIKKARQFTAVGRGENADSSVDQVLDYWRDYWFHPETRFGVLVAIATFRMGLGLLVDNYLG